MATRPKTGEKRSVRLPLKIDRFPLEVHEEIQKLRANGYSWDTIEEMSKRFVKWKELPHDIAALFPEKKLPHSNLQRWYDIRIEQVQKQVLADTEHARQFAEAFKGREFKDLDVAVINALRDQVFSLMRLGGDAKNQAQFLRALSNFGWLIAQFKKVDLAQEKNKAENRRVKLMEEEAARKQKLFEKATNDAAKKLGKGQALTVADINRIRERAFGLPPVPAAATASA